MMKSLRSLALLAAAAIAAGFCAAARAVAEIPSYVVDASRYVIHSAVSLLVGPPMRAAEPDRPVVRLVRATAYRLRLVKRERVLISPSWRMCPSC